jgi:t-SNARE complex subunit (syntaxin)
MEDFWYCLYDSVDEFVTDEESKWVCISIVIIVIGVMVMVVMFVITQVRS